jgi:hypothetical protein
MGARSLGQVRPNGVIACPILTDSPPSGKGPFMSTAVILAFPVAASAVAPKPSDPDESRRERGRAIAAVTRITQVNG